jgi:Asp-tRNA(Asn)/Glu-tRNA(Gln) amidotransferase A subunit family amidase
MQTPPELRPDAARATFEPRSYLALTPRLRAGEVSPREVLEDCLAAIERLEPRICAFVRIATD